MDSSAFFGISNLAYFIAMAAYISFVAFRRNTIAITATTVTIFGFICQTTALLIRWVDSFNIWMASAPMSRPRSGAFSVPPAVETWAPSNATMMVLAWL